MFTEKEKTIILKDFKRLSLQNEVIIEQDRLETDVLLTEHPLDTIHNEDLPES